MEKEVLTEIISKMLANNKFSALKELLTEMNIVDVAQAIEETESPEDQVRIFRLLPKEPAAEVFVELEPDLQELLIRGFSNTELKEVLDELGELEIVNGRIEPKED